MWACRSSLYAETKVSGENLAVVGRVTATMVIYEINCIYIVHFRNLKLESIPNNHQKPDLFSIEDDVACISIS